MSARKRRTWSAFGDVRRMPSDYEVMTHDTNWTLRPNRKAAFEQNPSSPANLWFHTYRDSTPLRVPEWSGFRDPDRLIYRNYVTMQSDAETRLAGVLEEYARSGATESASPQWIETLGRLFAPTRYPLHGIQQVLAYIGHLAPSSYITNAAAFSAADVLRRVTVVAYRTREIELAHPQSGVGQRERRIWEEDEAWQGVRSVVENLLVAYDWGEAYTALTLVVAPTLDEVLLEQFRGLAADNGDDLTWHVLGNLGEDARRRDRWAGALAGFAVQERPENADVLRRWIDRWSPRVDDAVASLATLFETLPEHGRSAESVVAAGRAAREALHEKAGLATAPV
ncbi:MAG: toluene hydroxylase [Pseudonocardia sp.]